MRSRGHVEWAEAGSGVPAGRIGHRDGSGERYRPATAVAAAALGLEVHGWDLDATGAGETAEEINLSGGRATSARVDVSDDRLVAKAFAAVRQPARYLVNNAGPPSGTDRSFNDGLVAGAGTVEGVTRRWLETGPPLGAAVVNVASVAGNQIGSDCSWYSATKAGIVGYTRHLAVHEAAAGRLRANAVAPGTIATPRVAPFANSAAGASALARMPLGRMGTPAEVAWAILFLLSPLAGYVNGALLITDGGWTITP